MRRTKVIYEAFDIQQNGALLLFGKLFQSTSQRGFDILFSGEACHQRSAIRQSFACIVVVTRGTPGHKYLFA